MTAVSTEKTLQLLLKTKYNIQLPDLKYIASGMFSIAYSYEVAGIKYVIRVNETKQDFLKDQFANQHFSHLLPVPKIIEIGQLDQQQFYATSEFVEGQTLDQTSVDNTKLLMPSIIDAIDKIHKIDVTHLRGYGLTDHNFTGQFDSWSDSLINFENHKIHYDWDQLFNNSILEKDFFNAIKQKMISLIPYCPESKWLIHGDVGFDNVLNDGQKITAILDWAEAKLGDYIYDIAWLDFWSDDIDYDAIFKNHYSKTTLPEHYDERLLCYKLRIALDGLLISAHFNNVQDYENIKMRMKGHQNINQFIA
jgi:hygromycin-B 4-O-kinase